MSSVSETGTSRGVWRVSSLASSSGRVNLLLFVLFVVSTLATSGALLWPSKDRHKRDIITLCKMINMYTGRGCVEYNGYGCYCGVDNIPGPPVDSADSCCQIHDNCLESIGDLCDGNTARLASYKVHCAHKKCNCDEVYVVNPLAVKLFQCKYRKCQCDVDFVTCLRRASYNRNFVDNCPRLREGKT